MFSFKNNIKELPRFLKFFKSNLSKLTYYEILEISKSATVEEIKKSYYIKVKLYHPDHNKDDSTAEENFKILVKAYETLKDPVKRQIYNLSFKNSNFKDNDSMEYEESFSTGEVAEKKAYYHNRWYSYTKPKEENLRDEYQKQRNILNKEEAAWRFVLFRLAIVTLILLSCDMWKYRKNMKMHKKFFLQKEVFTDAAKDTTTILESPDKFSINLNEYINERVKENECN